MERENRILWLKSRIKAAFYKDFLYYYHNEFIKDEKAFNKIFDDVFKIKVIAQLLTKKNDKGDSDNDIIYSVSGDCFNKIVEVLQESMDNLKILKEELSEQSDTIIFIGAGVSLEARLGWHTTNGILRQTLSNKKYSLKEIENEILEKDGKRCWNELIQNENARIKFQTNFTNAIRNKTPSESHYYLASLFKSGIIKHLVCFNWDNLIEKAYGNPEPPIAYLNHGGDNKKFWKPHGCVNCSIEHEWIFPPKVKMNSHFEEYVKRTIKGKKAGLVLSCGFSGSPEFTENYLTDLFGGCYFYDIRPDILKERELGKSIYMSASRVFKEIINELDPEFEFFKSLLQRQDIDPKTLKSIKMDREIYLKKHESNKISEKAIVIIKNSTIITDSVVVNSFNKIKENYGDDVANALLQIAKFIEKSGNKEAGELFDTFNEEINKAQPKKSVLKSLWDGIAKVLPAITTLSEAIAKLKSVLWI
jgi:hypothetical protein